MSNVLSQGKAAQLLGQLQEEGALLNALQRKVEGQLTTLLVERAELTQQLLRCEEVQKEAKQGGAGLGRPPSSAPSHIEHLDELSDPQAP
mmetsp:Transcript_6258/g.8466  ORF Transcript_6258/g.8466 Transcript_6258/m.8466 type:complete len:90 (+) Transcript_6258:351-620(+)